MKRDCDPLTSPTTTFLKVAADETVVGGGPLSMISSTACAATGSSSAANALDDDSRRRENRPLTRDARLGSAKLPWRIAPPRRSRAEGPAAETQATPPPPPCHSPVGSVIRRLPELQLIRSQSTLTNRRL